MTNRVLLGLFASPLVSCTAMRGRLALSLRSHHTTSRPSSTVETSCSGVGPLSSCSSRAEPDDWVEWNPGVFWEQPFHRSGPFEAYWTAGVIRNSFGRAEWINALGFWSDVAPHLRAGAVAGVGLYEGREDRDLRPLVGALALELGDPELFALEVAWIPSASPTRPPHSRRTESKY